MGDKIEIMDLKQDKIALEKELQNLVYGSVEVREKRIKKIYIRTL